jgi:thymidylate synthase
MRSNDAWLGLPHDVFAFTMLQEILARDLSVSLGVYKHAVGSMHLYERDRDSAKQFLAEGWQSTDMPMPPMPTGDPWLAIQSVLEAEEAIRNGAIVDNEKITQLDPYWADLIRLLQLLRCSRDGDVGGMENLRQSMASTAYHPYIQRRITISGKRQN